MVSGLAKLQNSSHENVSCWLIRPNVMSWVHAFQKSLLTVRISILYLHMYFVILLTNANLFMNEWMNERTNTNNEANHSRQENSSEFFALDTAVSVKLHLRHQPTNRQTDRHARLLFVCLPVCFFVRCVFQELPSYGWTKRDELRGRCDTNPGSTNEKKFAQLIIRKVIKIIAIRCHILRLKCT